MAPPRNIHPSRSLNTHLDEELMVRLDLHLFSEALGYIPKGAYKTFFNTLLHRYFQQEALDLSPYVGALPGEQTVRGTPEAIAHLRKVLEK